MIRVVLVNSIRILANVIAAVLENEPDIHVVGCTTAVDEALTLASQCDVLIASTRLPDNGALRITQAVAQANLPTKVLILGLAESREEVLLRSPEPFCRVWRSCRKAVAGLSLSLALRSSSPRASVKS